MNQAKQILTYLEQEQEKMVALLQQLALAESPSTVPSTQASVQAPLREALEALRFEVDLIAGKESGGHLYARPTRQGAGKRRQLLLGHSDTVWSVGTLKEMPLVVEQDRVKGPGVFDMKSGLTQMVFALRALDALSLTPTVVPELFINSDEELGSLESAEHIRRLAQEVCRVFVLEPALGVEGKLKTARKGVGFFRVIIRGKAAHAGLDPASGRSAILELAHVIQKLHALNQPEAGITVNVGTVSGGVRANVVAARSEAEVDVRVPNQAAAERITRRIRSLEAEVPGVTLEVVGGVNRAPLERTPRNQALWRTARSLGAELGLDLEEGMAGGGSDGNITSQFAATLDGLGGVGDGAHATHEFVYIKPLVERTALLALLLLAPA